MYDVPWEDHSHRVRYSGRLGPTILLTSILRPYPTVVVAKPKIRPPKPRTESRSFHLRTEYVQPWMLTSVLNSRMLMVISMSKCTISVIQLKRVGVISHNDITTVLHRLLDTSSR